MATLSDAQLRAYVEVLAEVNGDSRFGEDHLRRVAAAVPPFLALGERIPSWPEQVPAGPLDASE
jgi:hypothetical protein